MDSTIESLVVKAKEGDKEALEDLVKGIQDRIYGLAIRMLWYPEDAEDATQEILVKIITHLAAFNHESAFTTWAYRVAANHLLNMRKRRAEREYSSFDDFAEEIDKGLAAQWPRSLSEPESLLLVEEMMISCTQGMLICLDRDLRLAYILGEVFEVSSEEGGFILGIKAPAFRKRLSRARIRLHEFMYEKCGLINPSAPCTCTRQACYDTSPGNTESKELLFRNHPCRARWDPSVMERLQELGELERVAALFRNHPDYAAPESFVGSVKALIDSGRYAILDA